jgi:ADP-dependent NAD(P)H-hydrate dehydratase / NAD(P)H-hydrate epimerase
MLVTASQMKAAEELAFRSGVTPGGLMEIAGEGIAGCIREFLPNPGTVAVFCGKGHNGGDALVAARHLASAGWRVLVRLATEPTDLAPLTGEHLARLPRESVVPELPEIRGPFVLLDGLLGIGSSGTPRGSVAELIVEMNRSRQEQGGFSVAVDLPSGLEASTGEVCDPCVQADLTVTLGAVKSGLVADGATAKVGRLALVWLPGITFSEGDPAEVPTASGLRELLPVRDFDSFKGTYGRIGILAGSPGFLGAARLCSSAAVHTGGGLVTLYALPEFHDLLATSCISEVMVRKVGSYAEVLEERNDVLALGPGLGRDHDADLLRIVEEASVPCVVDADALNAVSSNLSILQRAQGPRLLTPHPGEMERLDPQSGRSRREWALFFTAAHPVTLLLKGARTIISERGHPLSFNSTGNPGMGSGGMGDVLTGVCAAQIGAGRSPREAAILGAWLCGRAAEIAVFEATESQESLSASSVITQLGRATRSLREGRL